MSQRIPWSSVATGDFVLGARDGEEWRVEDVSGGQVTLERAGRRHTLPLPPGAVLRTATGAEVAERALAVAQVKLGARVVAIDDGDERGHRCPAVHVDAASLAAHLYLFHGNPELGSATRAQLEGIHDQLHRDIEAGDPRAGTTKHWHDATFDKETR